jgi:Tol biopolymer transport system component
VYGLAWSPHIERFTFVGRERNVSGATRNVHLYVYDIGHNQVRQLTSSTTFEGIGNLTWSSDGQKLLFMTRLSLLPGEARAPYDERFQMYLADFTHPEEIQLTSFNDGLDSFLQPSWSPDNQQVAAYFSNDIFESSQIIVMNADGSEQKVLPLDFLCLAEPAWSPDGERIAFVARLADEKAVAHWRRGEWQLYTVRPDGSDLRTLTDIPAATITTPLWSPNGKQLAFHVWYHATRRRDVYLVNADASNLVRFGTSDERPYSIAWSPDGQYLAVGVHDMVSNEMHIDVLEAENGTLTRIVTIPSR